MSAGTVLINDALETDRFVLQSIFGKMTGLFEGAIDSFFFGMIGTSEEENAVRFMEVPIEVELVIVSEFNDIILGPSIIPFPVNRYKYI